MVDAKFCEETDIPLVPSDALTCFAESEEMERGWPHACSGLAPLRRFMPKPVLCRAPDPFDAQAPGSIVPDLMSS